ncbi:copper-binding protein [Allopontixanthobacter sp.]|uniref:copper-binding protein n=1 Tax=Allopontixanthobacter sp. TaxID=2906452 RepID=UPI002ABB6EAB|nr:copper-binding protein [Allopontixanthobacter sp.]MDZ4308092.1 copper-binding protein [Allopontixanthobacter sp.]
MRYLTWMNLLVLPFALAACDNAHDAEMPMENEDMAMTADEMPMNGDTMPMTQSGTVRAASAEGTVAAIDADAGTITMEHGPVPAMEWPAMTMAFDASQPIRDQVSVGDTVTFEFETSDKGNRIISVSKR